MNFGHQMDTGQAFQVILRDCSARLLTFRETLSINRLKVPLWAHNKLPTDNVCHPGVSLLALPNIRSPPTPFDSYCVAPRLNLTPIDHTWLVNTRNSPKAPVSICPWQILKCFEAQVVSFQNFSSVDLDVLIANISPPTEVPSSVPYAMTSAQLHSQQCL